MINLYKYKKSELIEMIVKANKETISYPSDVITPVLEELEPYRNEETEHFIVATLDNKHRVITCKVSTKGLVNRCIVHPREVFRQAIKDNACAIIVAHNHPSGNLEPSNEDVNITDRLIDAGKIIGIEILDHVIVGLAYKSYYSFLEHNKMKKSEVA